MDKTYNILIAEDDPSWQKKFERFLQDQPFTIFCATNYQEALVLVEKQNFDLAILDINLTDVPGNYDGLRIADRLWQRSRQVKIVIVSGIDDLDRRSGSLNFVPSCILTKQDFDPDDFVNKIRAALNE